MSDLYDEGCNTCRDLAVDSSFSFDESVIADALKRIYETDFNPMSEIEENLFRETWKTFNNAVDKGVSLATVTPASDFITQLKTNNAVFAAFRTHRMQNDIAAKLLDDKGNLKPFSQFAKDVLPITNHHVKSWLRTEYDTAVIRAHQAADWKQYEAEKDVLPNLEWLPSTSIVPGEDHRIFWGVVYPVNAAFWNRHKPGDRWNCKCRLQATDKATNVAHKYGRDLRYAPALGLDNNPAKDAMIFSKSHPFYTKTYPGAKKAVDKFLNVEEKVKETKFKSGGVLQIPTNFNQGVQEAKKNIKAYTELTKIHGEKYKLLNVRPNQKSPDAINLKNGNLSDAKIPESKSGKSAIQNSIKSASKQKVLEVYIYLDNDYNYNRNEIREGLLASFQKGRANSIKEVIIRFRDGEIKRYNPDLIRKSIKASKGKVK